MKDRPHEKQHWDRKAAGRGGDERVIAAFAATKIPFLESHIQNLSDCLTLEVGCGDGFISRHLMGKTRLLGVDFSGRMLARNPLTDKAVASAYRLPFADDSFDLVFESNVLHHLEEPAMAVAEMGRVSRRYVALSEPNARSIPIFISHAILPGEKGCLKYNRRYLERLLDEGEIDLIASADLGWVTPRLTPAFMLGILTWLEMRTRSGMFSMVIGCVR